MGGNFDQLIINNATRITVFPRIYVWESQSIIRATILLVGKSSSEMKEKPLQKNNSVRIVRMPSLESKRER